MNAKRSAIPLFKVYMAEEIDQPLLDVIHSGWIGEGPKVVEFEDNLARYTGNRNVLTLNSGTSALHLAYHVSAYGRKGYEARPRGEIITTPITCTATNTPILNNGLKIVWADVDPVTGSISPKDIRDKITDDTRAITMVHWGGNPCEIDEINAIAQAHGIKTIEDAAHSMGMEYKGVVFGNHSDFLACSLQAIKHVTSVDGGLLFCRSDADYRRVKLLRWYGIDRTVREGIDLRCEIDVSEAGYKFHMNDVCAVIGNTNFRHLPEILTRHRDNAKFYDRAFAGNGAIVTIPENPDGKSSYWLYTIHLDNRDEAMRKLQEAGIAASKVHARNDTHSMFTEFRIKLPGVEAFNRTHLCIPVGWWVTDEDREYIAERVIEFSR